MAEEREQSATDSFPDFSGVILEGKYQLLNVIGSVASRFTKPLICPCLALISWLSNASQNPNLILEERNFWIGGDLFAAMSASRFYNNEELVKQTMVQLIDALQYCHEQNVQHGDLKSSNVLLGPDDHIYLTDFGVCSETPISQYVGCGTARYLSPEALDPETNLRPFSTVHSDIWAVGIILVNLLTGHHPWLSFSFHEISEIPTSYNRPSLRISRVMFLLVLRWQKEFVVRTAKLRS
ncbi:kinase-like domain-containing protein [Mycena floridula]|nr:kinase-like domain-containing protein [Mycena floridula]